MCSSYQIEDINRMERELYEVFVIHWKKRDLDPKQGQGAHAES